MRQPIANRPAHRQAKRGGSRARTAIAAGVMLGATALLVSLGAWVVRSLPDLPAGALPSTVETRAEPARITAGPAVSPSAVPTPPADPAEAEPAASPGPAAPDEGDGIRYVEGAGIVATRVEGPLTRAPSAVVVPEPVPEEPKPTLYRLVVIEDADTVNLRTHTVQLANIAGPDADEVCTNAAGAAWPCGMRARTALRRLVRSRALECLDLPAPEGAPPRATCSTAGTNLSTWLVEQGWARPTDDAPDDLKAAHADAEAAGRGLFDPQGR